MAKKFQFRLEQVLSLRKQVEDVKIRELAHAKNRLLEIEQALKVHAAAELEFLDTYSEMEKAGAFNSDQIMVYCDYKDWLGRREKEYRSREKEWIKEVERRRQGAVKASKQRQLLDNFKEKQKDKYEKVILIEEQKFLDEVSSIAFVRRERAKKMIAAN